MQAFGLPGRLFVCLPFPPGICGESIIAVHTAPRRQVHSTLHWGGALVGEDLGHVTNVTCCTSRAACTLRADGSRR